MRIKIWVGIAMDKQDKVATSSVLLTSVCLVIGFNLRNKGLSIISHTWKRGQMHLSARAHFSPAHPLSSAPTCKRKCVYLLMDVILFTLRVVFKMLLQQIVIFLLFHNFQSLKSVVIGCPLN